MIKKLILLLLFVNFGAVISVAEAVENTPETSHESQFEPNSNQCFDIPDQPLDFNSISRYDVEAWSNSEDWHFITNTEYLAVGLGEWGIPYLRQKLEPTHKGSIHVVARGALQPSQSYTLSQSIYLEPGFDWGGKNEGGKLGFGLGGGSTPTGGMTQDDGFSARLMWRGNGDGSARLAVYAYSSDRSQNLPYGDDYPLQDFAVPVGEWFTVTLEVTANSGTGSSDGRVRVWANDVLRLQRDNIHWQARGETPVVDHLLYATFHGGNGPEWSPSETVYARFSSICWQPATYNPPPQLQPDLHLDGDSG